MSLQKLMTNYADYNAWANETLINYLKTKPAELMQSQIPSSFPSAVKTLNHIWAVEQFWQNVVSGEAASSSRYHATDLNTIEVFAGVLTQSQALAHYVAGLSEDELMQKVYLDTPWVKGELPRYEFLQHTFNHSTYHRGQVVTIGRNLGFTDAPMTDYNYYNMALLKRQNT